MTVIHSYRDIGPSMTGGGWQRGAGLLDRGSRLITVLRLVCTRGTGCDRAAQDDSLLMAWRHQLPRLHRDILMFRRIDL